MRKVVLFNMVSLDGYFESPDGDINWHTVDEEFNQFAIDQLDAADGLIFGRVTYELMAGYWPTPAALADDPLIANRMNALPKIVFSRTLEKVDWNNTRIIKANIVEELTSLKQQPGKDLLIFGSADLAAALIQNCLIDEFRVMVSPLILGGGTPLFQRIKTQLDLKLLEVKTFRNGNVLLTYQPNYQST